jgi:hypothetical protein
MQAFEANTESDKTYVNEQFGFQFLFTPEMLVCEGNFSTENGADELFDISLWDKDDFHSPVPRTGLISIINITSADAPNPLDQLPQPIILSQEESTVGGVPATRKEVRSSFCATPDCPMARLYAFTSRGHSFEIEERGAKDSVVGSFEFVTH